MSNDSNLTTLLFSWASGDACSGERLKTLIYHHCHVICKNHINNKRSKNESSDKDILDSLNTTSLLHNALLSLVPPKELYENRDQLFDYLSIFIRNSMVDEIRKKSAQKRGGNLEHISLTSFMAVGKQDEFLQLDMALNSLAKESKECARILNWRYFIGLSVDEIVELTGSKKSHIYKQIKAGKAFVISEMNSS
ncbi:ECF-type sigma factor [Marinicella gelatinilytica]|uniref:ECF-type sigma factor n=1 Tax=Marinicella gelatinilytica TaxID=2996017 RepID=UPI002260F287|nr:ECF-type sigma factor [Marinicella gelatinilytica]MCX7544406.1 ECF-type sigma factor [Marinicella gelatinilytica]